MLDDKASIVKQLGWGEQVAAQAIGQTMAMVVIAKHHIACRLQSTGNVSVTTHVFTQPMQQQNSCTCVFRCVRPSIKGQGLLALIEHGDLGFLGRLVGN